jgi:hypothetical protein
VPVHVTVTTNATVVRLVSASGDDGAVASDLSGWVVDSWDVDGSVRATRSGGGTGRTYSLVYEATGANGETAQCTATIAVAHDQGK